MNSHPEYEEYATCSKCGLKKMCVLAGRLYICFACDHGNFKGLRNMKEAGK